MNLLYSIQYGSNIESHTIGSVAWQTWCEMCLAADPRSIDPAQYSGFHPAPKVVPWII